MTPSVVQWVTKLQQGAQRSVRARGSSLRTGKRNPVAAGRKAKRIRPFDRSQVPPGFQEVLHGWGGL